MAGHPHHDHIKTPAAPLVADCGVRKYTETVNSSVVGRVDRHRTFEGTTGLPRHWRVAFGMKGRKPPLARHRIPIFRGDHRFDRIISIGNLPSKSLSEPQRTGSVVNLGGKGEIGSARGHNWHACRGRTDDPVSLPLGFPAPPPGAAFL
ncbi:hypothetical protein B0H17DRAFT_1133091 [Mycena rosella]|uniref:Uncharacterized protein n=1 Tax=Mycena rosella TaxID=1033263 RepID=A0AAD7DJY3_MYCRO|nr:hypothetical protein B0H17DRAFT_1133091 [Mycena rosella]